MKEYDINELKSIVAQQVLSNIVINGYGIGIPENCNIYNLKNIIRNKEIWYVKYSLNDNKLKSTSVIILEMGTNKVLYNGSCNDEG